VTSFFKSIKITLYGISRYPATWVRVLELRLILG
jgi:hypothetical protein